MLILKKQTFYVYSFLTLELEKVMIMRTTNLEMSTYPYGENIHRSLNLCYFIS